MTKKIKRLIAALLCVVIVMGFLPAAPARAAMTQTEAEAAVEKLNENSEFYYELTENYGQPDIEYRSEVRWWMAEGYHTDETLEEEIQAIYDAGFRGIELCQLNDKNISAKEYGYGSAQWNHDFHFIMNKALDLGMTVGMTAGAGWASANVPGLDSDSQAANQCIYQVTETVAAGATRTGAIPEGSRLRAKANFIGAYAWPLAQAKTSDNRYIQTTEMPSDPTTFTIEVDFIVDQDGFTLFFDGTDTENFIMWQINTVYRTGKTYCRPHLRIGGSWKGTKNYDITSAIGYGGSDMLGKEVHMKIEVIDGNTINTYFNGSETAAFTYTLTGQAGNWNTSFGSFSLGKLGFRMNTDHGNTSEELARCDNLIVKDADGNVIYENTFSDPDNPGFAGPNCKVVDGMLSVGWPKVPADQVGAIDGSKILDLTEYVVLDEAGHTGTLEWTAPSDGSYTVIYYWQQGSGHGANPATVTSYTVNYFDRRGLEALKEYWLENVLNDPELNEKIKNSEGGVQLFHDSMEYNNGYGFNMWPENFDEIFYERKGYDVKPYMFLSIGLPSLWSWRESSDMQGTYKLTDSELQQRVLNDIYDVQTQLLMEEFLIPFREWLNSYGITLRIQPSYGKYLEISEPIQAVDFPEAENRNQGNEPDMYRLWTGGSHLQNKVLSSETGGLDDSAYSYDNQRHLQEAYMQYAVGYSRIIWHIWSAIYSPTQSWPGYEGGMSQYYKFGTREPSYSEYNEFNDHLGRIQQLLRQGSAGVDVGMIYLQYGQRLSFNASGHALSHTTMFFPSEELQNNGYSYDYFSPDFLTADGVSYDAENGTLEMAGYKALVLWQDELPVDGAEALLEYAKQGMKVVIVDGAAVRTPYNDGDNEALAAVIEELKTLPSVATAASADDVMETLQEMGVEPYAGFAQENQQLLGQVRREGDDRYLYLYNYCDGSFHDEGDADHGSTVTTEIEMDGIFVPYAIDAWTGEVSQIAGYRYEDGKTVFEVTLDYGDVALYAFEAVTGESLHITETGLDAYVSDGAVMVRSSESGEVEVNLSDGSNRTLSFDVPESYDITGWDLTVESWTPGETVSRAEVFNGVTTTEYAVLTNKAEISVQLDTLTTWDNIAEVGKSVSGKGTYTAAFNWSGEADGAYLDLGPTLQSMQVFINGVKTDDVSMMDPVVDISDLLVIGENTVEIRYSSNLTNVQLSRGIIEEGVLVGGFVGYDLGYRSYGPAKAEIVPYVELAAYRPVTGVTVSLEQMTLNEGYSYQLEATVAPADATDLTVIWTSSDEAVATVDENGMVTAVAPGSAVITVTTADGGFSAECAVTVQERPPVDQEELAEAYLAAKEAQEAAEKAQAAAEAAQAAAERAQDQAAADKSAADAAMNAAEAAKKLAEDAKAAAEEANAAAHQADAEAAENARAAAEAAASASEASASAAQAAETAQTAQTAAEAARDAARQAAAAAGENKTAAEAAAKAADTAEAQAAAAKADALKAQAAAGEAAAAAAESDTEAAKSAAAAAGSARDSAASASAAAKAAGEAADSAMAAAEALKAAEDAEAEAKKAAEEAAADQAAAEEARKKAEAAQAAADKAAAEAALSEARMEAYAVLNDHYQSMKADATGTEKTALAEAARAARAAAQAADSAEALAEALEAGLAAMDNALCPAKNFIDVDLDEWYHDAIDFVLKEGIMSGNGDGTFTPEASLTRAMLVQILYNIEGRPEVDTTKSFTDVAEDDWYSDAVLWAAENGIVLGYNDGSFGAEDDVTREQMVTILWRYAGQPGVTAQRIVFADSDRISDWAVDAVLWAYENKIVQGVGNDCFDPTGASQRAAAAQVMMNYFGK